jgi:hypothetical protein
MVKPEWMHLATRHVCRERGDVKLNVWRAGHGAAVRMLECTHETAALIDAHGQRARSVQQPLQPQLCCTNPGIQLIVGGNGFAALKA